MKSIRIEIVFIIVTIFAGIAANTSFAKNKENNKFAYPTAYPTAYPPAGTLDNTFDSDGLLTTAIGSSNDQAYAVAVDVDHRIVVAGSFSNPGYNDFFLARYYTDGSLDTNFDTDGIVTTSFGNIDTAQALVIQDDEKIVVAGYTSPDGSEAELALARYNWDGSLDTSFDTDGKVTTDLGSGYDFLGGMAIQPIDGKIVVVGSKYIGINNSDIAVIRYNTNGSLDTTFDTDGIVTTSIGSGEDGAVSVAIQADGKIVVGGSTYNGSNTDFALLRYNSNGSLDTTFDSDGIVTRSFSAGTSNFERGGHVVLQPDGKIIIAGNNEDSYFLLARYQNNGSLDTTFDTDGLVATYFFNGSNVQDIALQKNGKIVLAGFTNGSDYNFAVARYKSNGSLDTNFDSDGKVTTDFGSNKDDLGNAVSIQKDGKIVVAGYRLIGSNYDVALARYLGDPNATLIVNSNTDTIANDGVCTLREAITNINNGTQAFNSAGECAAGTTGVGTITFAANYTITLGSQLPSVTSSIIINGKGAANTIIQANATPDTATYRVFQVGASGDLTLDSLTVRNGRCNGSCAVLVNDGGGVFNQGTLAIKNSLFTTNVAVGDGGGGLYNYGGNATITASTFYQNSSLNAGGAIINDGGIMAITNSTVASNSATGNTGGGIGNYGTLNIYNSTISGNTSVSVTYDGDNIYQGSGVLNLYNTIVANSTSHGDCYIGGGTVNATNSLIESTGSQACGLVNGSNGNKIGSDPALGVLTGSPGYLPLLPGSPAIDTGDDTICAAVPVSNTSQNGVTRPHDGHCDIGSFEFGPFSSVSKWSSSFDLSHGWTVADYARTVGDVNNDGRDDLIGFGSDGVYVALSNGTGFGAISKWSSSFDLSHGWTVASYVRTVGDVNNDGRDDLIGFGLDGVYVALSNGTSFDAVSKWSSSFDLSHGWTVASYVRTVGDVNNDGREDLIGFGLDGVYVALSNGTGFGAISKWSSSFDLSHGWTVASYVRTVGDVNNDGRDDLIGFGSDGVYVALSNGASFDAISKWSSSFDLSHGWTVASYVRTAGDVNNDGRDDLIGFGSDGVYIALSNGTGFGSIGKWSSSFDLSHGWTVADYVRTVGDVNNDGKADLVGFGLDGVYVATAQ